MSAVAGRLRERLDALAQVSDEGEGVTRLAYSPREREAHELLTGWEPDARATRDAAGNTILEYREGEPYLLVGSHLDSVPRGGAYDGTAGVLAAVEAARDVAEDIGLGLRVVVFAAEEGARFGRPCLGSQLATGAEERRAIMALTDAGGTTVGEAASSLGLAPARCEPWLRGPGVACFLEVHIEQGSVLESEQVPLGVVDVIAGTVRFEAELRGRAEHSGATPMHARADALAAAAEVILAVEAIGSAPGDGVATVGRIEPDPNVATTIAGAVRLTIDVRDTDAGRQRSASEGVRAALADVAARRGIACTVRELGHREPVMLSAWPRQALAAACAQRGVPYRILPSGAGHDAAVVALRAPAALLFVATPSGRSHVPEEDCRVGDLALAVDVLADALRRLDRDARPGVKAA